MDKCYSYVKLVFSILLMYQSLHASWITAASGTHSLVLQNASNEPLQIQVGKSPKFLAWHEKENLLVVTNSESNNLSVINLNTYETYHSLPIFKDPRGVIFDKNGGSFYVVSKDERLIYRLCSKTLNVLNTYPTGESPRSITMNYARDKIFVSNNGDASVSIIQLNDPLKHKKIPVGKNPYGLAFDPRDSRLYITSIGENTIWIVDTKKMEVIDVIPVARHPTHLCLDPKRDRLYVTCMDDNLICVINLHNYSVEKKVPTQKAPFSIALDKDLSLAVVTCNKSNSVQTFDLDSFASVNSHQVGNDPHGIIFISPQ